MGAGRKTQTLILNERPPSSSTTVNASVSARHLRKNDLGGVIFGCKNNTMMECLSKQLFGLPAPHFAYVRNINPGLPLFLFNYSDRKLHGIFESASTGQMNIDPYGWTEDGSERTPYPAQVRICIRTQCQPLLEKQFRPKISDNFFTASHFWFELDHSQVESLIKLFTPAPFSGNAVSSPITSKRNSLLNVLPAGKWQPIGGMNSTCFPSERMNSDTSGSKKDLRPLAGLAQANRYETLPWDDAGNNECGSSSKTSSSTHEDGEFKPISEWDLHDPEQVNMDFVSSSANPSLNGESQTFDEAGEKDVDIVLSKLKQLMADRERLNEDCSDDIAGPSVIRGIHQDDERFPGLPSDSEEYEKILSISSDPYPDIAQLRKGMDELKNIALQQLQRTRALETKLVESDMEIQQLKERVKELESLALVNESLNVSINMLNLDHEGPIYLLGGYDGISWLSALDSYSPSKDIMTSLRPMSSARSYASAATLNGNLYIFGGGDGRSWYDTVESYCPSKNMWTLCPPLVRRKGCLAGATLHSKIFAIGGGDGVESFSDVEMLDPALGRWIYNPSMLQKRFATAAAELNGVLYAVGGYDGNDYLKSAERFDPREASWARLPSMETRRGCHSLAIINEKLYAVGGYDGAKMVSSTEVFEPRTSSWMMGDPLNHPRGYAATAVLEDSIYLIGGMKDGASCVDTVECYKAGSCWRAANSRAIGKRCFLSVIVL
ncbi:uncharacterized protein LOC131253465 isoform X2 [Magnolia sinica]|nr:uncharacterized protein LOC131253465 isoform X2 [Magnolia sinica]XP_058110443.1 uncharacterized protein LOC131253465 isoform X2 [Magnolia sinica]XP_058110444.1 uncharacterized protein LOC131253465 isoform X2 [Magnolia sinica]